jgi:RHS repeat-associated protein
MVVEMDDGIITFKIPNLRRISCATRYISRIRRSLSFYQHKDHLGTSRLASSWNQTVVYDKVFAAFGEDYNDVNDSQNWDWVFAGMTANIAAGSTQGSVVLYDAMYREYAPGQGRWISPDPAGLAAVDPTNPQTWNRYAYALNNPVSFRDPTGLYCQWDDGTRDDDPSEGGASFDDCADQGGTWVDTTIVNVNGDQPPDGPSSTFENGDQIFPTTVPLSANHTVQGLQCAAQFGTNHSIAAAFDAQGNFLANLFGGNSVSGLVNLGLFISGDTTPTVAQLAAIPLKGAAQGIPVPPGNPGLSGAVGQVRGLGVRARRRALTTRSRALARRQSS